MTLDYQDHHCKMCGKYDKLAWVNGGYCDDCFKLRNLAKIRESIEEGEPDTFSSDYVVCPYCGAAIKAITNGEFKRQSDFGTVYVVKDQLVDDYGVLEVIKVFEQLDDAQKYVMAHPRAALLPRKVIKHGKIEK